MLPPEGEHSGAAPRSPLQQTRGHSTVQLPECSAAHSCKALVCNADAMPGSFQRAVLELSEPAYVALQRQWPPRPRDNRKGLAEGKVPVDSMGWLDGPRWEAGSNARGTQQVEAMLPSCPSWRHQGQCTTSLVLIRGWPSTS